MAILPYFSNVKRLVRRERFDIVIHIESLNISCQNKMDFIDKKAKYLKNVEGEVIEISLSKSNNGKFLFMTDSERNAMKELIALINRAKKPLDLDSYTSIDILCRGRVFRSERDCITNIRFVVSLDEYMSRNSGSSWYILLGAAIIGMLALSFVRD